MAKIHVTIRLENETVEKLQALAAALSRGALGRVTVSHVVTQAVDLYLDQVEQNLRSAAPTGSSGKKQKST